MAGLQIVSNRAFKALAGVNPETMLSPWHGNELDNLVGGKYWPQDTKFISDEQPIYTTNIGDCTAGLFLAKVLDSDLKLPSDIFSHLNCGRNLDQSSFFARLNPFIPNDFTKTFVDREFSPILENFFSKLDDLISSGELKGKTLEFSSLLAGGWAKSDFPQDSETVDRSLVLKNKLVELIGKKAKSSMVLANEHGVNFNHLDYLLWGQSVQNTKEEILVPFTHIHYDPAERIISVNCSQGVPQLEEDGSDYGKLVIKQQYEKAPRKHFKDVKVV